MPFKSKAQQRFMFAAEDRGDLPEGTAKRWADHTPSFKKLPEKVHKRDKTAEFRKAAFELGKAYAIAALRAQLESSSAKTAAFPTSVMELVQHYGPYVAGPLVGTYLAGPGYRAEGALAGLGGAYLAKHFARGMVSKQSPELKKLMDSGWTPAEIARGLRHGDSAFSNMKNAPELLKRMQLHEAGAAALGGGAGGLVMGRALGAQNPYGMAPVFPGLEKSNPEGLRDPSASLFQP